jgi:hypothetical protein
MEVCSAQRAEMDFPWGSCLMTVARRRARARPATGGAAGQTGLWLVVSASEKPSPNAGRIEPLLNLTLQR